MFAFGCGHTTFIHMCATDEQVFNTRRLPKGVCRTLGCGGRKAPPLRFNLHTPKNWRKPEPQDMRFFWLGSLPHSARCISINSHLHHSPAASGMTMGRSKPHKEVMWRNSEPSEGAHSRQALVTCMYVWLPSSGVRHDDWAEEVPQRVSAQKLSTFCAGTFCCAGFLHRYCNSCGRHLFLRNGITAAQVSIGARRCHTAQRKHRRVVEWCLLLQQRSESRLCWHAEPPGPVGRMCRHTACNDVIALDISNALGWRSK